MVNDGHRHGCLSLEVVGNFPLVEVALPVACPDTVTGILKLPVNAARSAADVNTFVWAVELLVTGAKSLPLVPPSLRVPSNAEALKDSLTEGMVTAIAPDGTLIDRLPLVVPVIVLLEAQVLGRELRAERSRCHHVHLGQGSHRRAEIQESLVGHVGKRLEVRKGHCLGHCRRGRAGRSLRPSRVEHCGNERAARPSDRRHE